MNTKLIRRTYGHLKGYLKDEVDYMSARDFLRICSALYAMEDLLAYYEEATPEPEQQPEMEKTATEEEEIPEGEIVAHWDFTE